MAADRTSLPTKAAGLPRTSLDIWTYSTMLYGWVPQLSGSNTIKGRTFDVSVTFDDMADLVRRSEIPSELFGMMSRFEARKAGLSLWLDLIYLNVALSGSMARSRGTDALNAGVGAAAGLRYQMAIAEAAAGYELARWNWTGKPGSDTALDVIGGARGWWQRADASIAASGTLNSSDLTRNANGTFSAAASAAWLDPLIGARLRHQFAPGLRLDVTADLGGFGVGSSFSWETVAALKYDFALRNDVTWTATIGYRALYVDYTKGSGSSLYKFDMTMQGPVFGVTARF